MTDEQSAAAPPARSPPFPGRAAFWFLVALAGLSAPALLGAGIAPEAVEWLLRGSGGRGQGWQFLGAVALCIGSATAVQWAAERFSLKFPLYVGARIVFALTAGLGCFAVAFIWASLSDATGSGLVAGLLLLLIASAVGNVVLAAQRQDYLAADHKLEFLRDWLLSVAMVVGGLFLTMFSSFQIGFLLVALAEHQLLPSGLSNAILTARQVVGWWSWLALQLCSVVAMVVWTSRFGVGRPVEAFGIIVLAGLVSVGLSFVAFVAVIALGPPLH